MNNLNVFKNPYYKWTYLEGWIKNCKMFCRSFKYAWQRITRGYSDADTWDLNTYYLYLFHDTLNYLADHHYGYPGNDEFPKDEDWIDYLKTMANKFELANEDAQKLPTPAADKWYEWLEQHPTTTPWSDNSNPYNQAMYDEFNENDKQRDKEMREGMDMLKHVMWHLWD